MTALLLESAFSSSPLSDTWYEPTFGSGTSLLKDWISVFGYLVRDRFRHENQSGKKAASNSLFTKNVKILTEHGQKPECFHFSSQFSFWGCVRPTSWIWKIGFCPYSNISTSKHSRAFRTAPPKRPI